MVGELDFDQESRESCVGREEEWDGPSAVDSPKVLPPPSQPLPVEQMRGAIEEREASSHSHPAKEKADRENNNDLEIMRLLKRIIYFVKWR